MDVHGHGPYFPVHHCNVCCILGILALYFCSVESHPPITVQNLAETAFSLLLQPRVLYKGLFFSMDCTALLWLLEYSRAICFTKGSETPVELHN